MITYLLCKQTHHYFTMPENVVESEVIVGRIYKANRFANGYYGWDNNWNCWSERHFKEITQAEAFARTKGNIDLVEELF